jgi:hypothetical protein
VLKQHFKIGEEVWGILPAQSSPHGTAVRNSTARLCFDTLDRSPESDIQQEMHSNSLQHPITSSPQVNTEIDECKMEIAPIISVKNCPEASHDWLLLNKGFETLCSILYQVVHCQVDICEVKLRILICGPSTISRYTGE